MKIEQLEKLLSDATHAPWYAINAFAAHDSIYPSVNGDYLTIIDEDLICALRNAAPAMIDITRYAKFKPEADYITSSGARIIQIMPYDWDRLQVALQKLEEVE